MKVVVVDDDPVILKLMERLLHQRGHTVLTYANPLECPLYKSSPCPCIGSESCPDIIITDYNMPRVNGLDFLQDVYKRGCKCTNLAIITAKGLDERDMQRIARLGTRFFLKPIDSRELYAWVDRVEQKATSNASVQSC
jgi:DNA-binding response OmpR family regulator